jgi:hypothetical protein
MTLGMKLGMSHPKSRAWIPKTIWLATLAAWILVRSAPARAESLDGRVRNGTTNQPAAGVEVQLIQLQQGMTPVASATTNAQGLFHFDGVEQYTSSPVLLQAVYQQATYSQPLLSPKTMASGIEMMVYDATHDKSVVSVGEHAIFLRPSNGELAVIEQISIANKSTPPRTYVNQDGTYLFSLPGKPHGELQASIEGAAGMPIPQVPAARGKPNSFAITYPIRPGESQIRLEYSLDYQSPLHWIKRLDQPGQQTHIVTPGEGVQISGEDVTAVGKEPTTGFLAYQVAPGVQSVDLQISGYAPETQAESQTAEPADSGGGLIEIPDPATERKWMILSGLGLIMLAGFAYLSRR